MIEHVSEQDLSRLILTSDEVPSGQRERWELHLNACALCREHYESIRNSLQRIEAELLEPPTKQDHEIAQRLFSRKRLALPLRAIEKTAEDALDAYAEIIEPYRGPLIRRLVRYIQFHPVRIAGGFSLAAALTVLALTTFRPIGDSNPSYARAKDEFLVVYNAGGDELWRKHIGYGYDADFITKTSDLGLEPEGYLRTVDVDGDGKKEIVSIVGFAPDLGGNNTVNCYQYDGTLRWTYEIHRDMTFGTEHFSDNYKTRQLFIEDLNLHGQKRVIVSANHSVYYPSVVLALSGSDGTLIAEHWEAGAPNHITPYDLDGDGLNELLVPGENNSFDRAFLAILDPRNLRGHSPSTPQYTPVGIPDGNQLAYILFPRSDVQSIGSLQSIDSRKRNRAVRCKLVSDSVFLVEVQEFWNAKDYAGLIYYFNSRLECTRVDASDPFVLLHRRLESEGKLTAKLDAAYFEALRRGVQYWDGEKFVSEPTMNKRFQERSGLP